MILTEKQQKVVDTLIQDLHNFNISQQSRPGSLINFEKINAQLIAKKEQLATIKAKDTALRNLMSKTVYEQDFPTIKSEVEQLGLQAKIEYANNRYATITIFIREPILERDSCVLIFVQTENAIFNDSRFIRAWYYEFRYYNMGSHTSKDIKSIFSHEVFQKKLEELYLKSKGF